jgi:glycosyltransferase involved in cell wall biosynthesis
MISIIIPSYNTGKFLRSTLESILYQEGEYEVIVVDSHSTDGTLGLLDSYQRKFDGRLHVALMGREGQVKAINYGMSLAHGDILTFLNTDDTYERGCFKRVVKAFEGENVEWVYGKGFVIDENGRISRGIVTTFKSIWWGKGTKRILSWFDYISQPTVFWRRSLWDKVGELNPEFRLCFDYEMWLRFWKVSNPLFINQHLANWRAHSDAISVRNTNAQIDESLRINLQYARNWWDVLIQNGVALAEKVVYGVIK